MKKVKARNEMVYKKGLAVVVEEVIQQGTEYDQSHETVVKLFFKSKNAINNACKILGYKLNKKKTIQAFERGMNGFVVRLDSQTEFALKVYFDYKNHIGRNGFYFNYQNHYSDSRVSGRIYAKNILDLKNRYAGFDLYDLETSLGSVADSDGTFKNYLDRLADMLEEGYIIYCPSV